MWRPQSSDKHLVNHLFYVYRKTSSKLVLSKRMTALLFITSRSTAGSMAVLKISGIFSTNGCKIRKTDCCLSLYWTGRRVLKIQTHLKIAPTFASNLKWVYVRWAMCTIALLEVSDGWQHLLALGNYMLNQFGTSKCNHLVVSMYGDWPTGCPQKRENMMSNSFLRVEV